jgi:hypothetical protein
MTLSRYVCKQVRSGVLERWEPHQINVPGVHRYTEPNTKKSSRVPIVHRKYGQAMTREVKAHLQPKKMEMVGSGGPSMLRVAYAMT